MTVEPNPVRKTPWLLIILGALAALCLCVIVIGAAILAFLLPTRVSTATEIPPVVIFETGTALPSDVPTQETVSPAFTNAAPAGTAVEIGSDMTLTILDVTRPADDLVANGSVLNTTAPAGEEFMKVDVEVTCDRDPGTQCTFYPTVVKAILRDGSTRDLQTFIEGVEEWDTLIEIEGGTTEQGFLLFIVPEAESDIILTHNDSSTAQPVYLQLP